MLAKSFPNRYVKYVKYVRTRWKCLYVLYIPCCCKEFQKQVRKVCKVRNLGGFAFWKCRVFGIFRDMVKINFSCSKTHV